MEDVAVFFSEGAVADEGREAEVQEFGEGAGFGVDLVGGSDAVEAADDAGKLLVEDALKVDVFLVGADYVWGGGKGVIEAGRWLRGMARMVGLCVGGCHGRRAIEEFPSLSSGYVSQW